MIKTTFKWNGKDVKIKGKNMIGKSVFESGIIIQSQAAALCPVNYGTLRDSISVRTREKTKSVGRVESEYLIDSPFEDNVALVGTNIKYSFYVEYGTKPHMPPVEALKRWAKLVLGNEKLAYPIALGIKKHGTKAQPFMRPAIDLATGKVLNVFEVNGRKEFREYFKEK